MANKTITQLDAAQSLNDNMVIAVQDTNTTYKATLADVKAYCGATPAGDKYKVGDRVNDDSNNPVGTVSSIFTDGNGDRYAVVCLDNSTWGTSRGWSTSDNEVTGLPKYDSTTRGPWKSTETATFNTQKILDYCTSIAATSSACTHCRTYSYTIDGVVYYGQLPNEIELCDICENITINVAGSPNIWSSNQKDGTSAWGISSTGAMTTFNKTNGALTIPVLEIPLED